VVGLGTWELRKSGRAVEAIMTAASPQEAVEMAFEVVGGRGPA
jgi:hypothetical protein